MPTETEIAIVGAGPAGLAAAAAASAAGCRVTIVDAYNRLGGQYYKQTPAEFGAQAPHTLHHDFSVAERLFAAVTDCPSVSKHLGASVWTAQGPSAPGEPTTLYVTGEEGGDELRARHVILAPGAYDRALPFPGWDLPGVMTAGAAQSLVKSQRVLPGRRVVLSGSGPFLLPVAVSLAQGGAEVVAVYEATTVGGWARHAPRAWGHWDKLAEGRDYAMTLRKHGVPVSFGRAVVRAEGDSRVQQVTVAQLAADWSPIPGSEERLQVDTLCTGYGFVPSTELSYLLGCAHRFEPVQGAFIARHDGDMRSSRPGIFVAGEITGIGGSAVALPQGAIAGLAAARALGRLSVDDAAQRMAPHRRALRHQHAFATMLQRIFQPGSGWMTWMAPDTIVCRCEEVTRRQIETAIQEYHARDVKTVKSTTRCGMGLCQGRVCGHVVATLTAALSGRGLEDVGAFTGRPIVKPVSLSALNASNE